MNARTSFLARSTAFVALLRRALGAVVLVSGPSLRRGVLALALLACALPLTGCSRLLARHGARTAAVPAAATAAGAPHADVPRDPSEPYWPYAHANALLAADSLAAAEAELMRALALDPTYAPALSRLAELEFRAGRYREGVTLLEPVRLQPESFAPAARARLLAALALHADALGDVAKARAALAAAGDAVAKGAGSAAVYVTLRGETPDAATAMAREAAGREGRSAVARNNLGITRLRSGDLDGARRAFADAIERDPALAGPYYNLAILEKYWRFDDAAATRWFREYWQRSHDDPDGLYPAFAAALAAPAPSEGARP